MIIFENERINIIRDFLKKNNINKIKKDIFFQRHQNGWGAYSTIKKFQYSDSITDIIIFSLPPMTYIAHKHITDIDNEYYHYVLKCNKKCGIIIENEYINYYKGLLFGFNPKDRHIVWNYGKTHRESLVFIFKKENISYEKWLNEKIKIANKENEDTVDLDKQEIIDMTEKFKIKIL